MELTMINSFGFCELNEQETRAVDGGGLWIQPNYTLYLANRTARYIVNTYNYNMAVSQINGYNDTVTASGHSELIKSYPEKPTW
ncbi:MAG: hypothetical protein J6K17_07380 [Oscillospiraceae bacterium]|nr:hypothetical protein [Oscillospiraceae bacterium]